MTRSTAHRIEQPAVMALALAYWRLHRLTKQSDMPSPLNSNALSSDEIGAFLSELEMARTMSIAQCRAAEAEIDCDDGDLRALHLRRLLRMPLSLSRGTQGLPRRQSPRTTSMPVRPGTGPAESGVADAAE